MAGEYVKNLDQRVETLWQKVNKMGNGGTVDAYTKTESDAKFVPKDADDKYFTVNGIRVYVASSAPTGNIPDGSIGFGW